MMLAGADVVDQVAQTKVVILKIFRKLKSLKIFLPLKANSPGRPHSAESRNSEGNIAGES